MGWLYPTITMKRSLAEPRGHTHTDREEIGYKFSEEILSKVGSSVLLLPNLGFSEPSEKKNPIRRQRDCQIDCIVKGIK